MDDIDIELGKAEQELLREETALATEVTRLAGASRQLADRLERLKGRLAEAATQGMRDVPFEQRVQGLSLPVVSADDSQGLARDARRGALAARRTAAHEQRLLIRAVKEQLVTFGRQLSSDEQAAEKLLGHAKMRQRGADLARPMSPAAPRPPAAPAVLDRSAPLPSINAMPVRAKRASPRVQMQVTVDLTSSHNFFSGFSSNISDGGLFVATTNLVELGTMVDLSFSLPGSQRIAVHGVVRWVRQLTDGMPEALPGIGVQFVELPADALQAITEFVGQREPIFYPE